MAGKTKEMSQIKQLLLLKKEGVSNRKAADMIGINKETANNYVRKAYADELGIDGLLKLDDPVLEHRLKGGNPAYTDQRFEVFKEMLPYLQEEMKRKHVTLKLLWEEYVEEHPTDHYSLTQFRYHYNQNTEAKKDSPSTILSDMREGGEKLFLDFTGDTMGYVDRETGEFIRCQAFVATLPASDYGYMLCVPSQRTEDFVYAIIQCLKHLGGVPKMLVPDNLKAAVIKTDRYEPTINRVLEDMANHYGTVVVPTRPAKPKDKPNVEGDVRIVYMRVFAELRNETFFSLEELNAAVV
jgi:transposase